jgi:hypothetical protein
MLFLILSVLLVNRVIVMPDFVTRTVRFDASLRRVCVSCHSKRFITYLVPLPVYSGFVRWICISCPSRRSKSV